MNGVDVLLIIIFLMAVWSGYQKGFILGSLDLLSLAGSLLAAFAFYPYLAVLIEKYFSIGPWTIPVAFIILYIIARIIVSFIINNLLRRVSEDAHREHANKILGMLPGGINGVIYATIVSALLLAIPLFDGLSIKTRESQIASRLSIPAEWLESTFSPVFDEAARRTMNKMTVAPDSEKSIELNFTVKDPEVREDLEARMLEMVNEERAKEGLPPVKADPEMTEVARKHSKDMFARGYFSHHTPEGKDPFDRMKEDGVRFLTAGENLALAQTLRLAHTGLMNSPGHKANILRPAFGRLGIGILDGGMYGIMVTQNFRN